MNREKLISYAVFFNGEYDKIMKAIDTNIEVPSVEVENAITIFDKEYPKELLELKYPPFVLFYKGNLKLLKTNCIGIVGSRTPCDYALKTTKCLVQANIDKTIVSGLAMGIETCACENAKNVIGILGCGIDFVYPRHNYDLINKVAKYGLLLSEYPCMVQPLGYHFPFRNRIIACLSNKLYIMQSNQKSGTMAAINEALELGKEIKALPYRIIDKEGYNNNKLINEGMAMISKEELGE